MGADHVGDADWENVKKAPGPTLSNRQRRGNKLPVNSADML